MVKKVSDDLLSELAHGGCVDEHLRDQLVVFQALAEGRSTVDGGRKTIPNEGELIQSSLHARTAMWVTNKLLGIDFNEEGSCNGIGFDPSPSTSSSSEEDLQNLTENIQDLNISTS
jgi:RNA 3'-terminal phosphate cyclase (ATP)